MDGRGRLAVEQREAEWRRITVTFFPMAIAALSLVTSIYNGYLNNRFVDLIENNVARLEYMRTCKEIIDAYFQVKVRAGALSGQGDASRRGGPALTTPRDQFGAAEAVARFGALGTYLANLRDEKTRERYTQLTWALEKIVADAPATAPAELPKHFQKADGEFGSLNDDCVRSAKSKRM